MEDEPVQVPHPLSDVEDPCEELYYPSWSSRGMRAVRCTRPARATVQFRDGDRRRVCGVHVGGYLRMGPYAKVVRDA